jgi:DNA-binding MarR family transcriptional regulator
MSEHLDRLTPTYRAAIVRLPPQQRQVLDAVARVPGGARRAEIRERTRIAPSVLSSQLRRLEEAGWVLVMGDRVVLQDPDLGRWWWWRYGEGRVA